MKIIMLSYNFGILLFFSLLLISDSLKLSLIEKTYKKGLKAYKEERWSECIAQFEESLHLYKVYKSLLTNCRFKCNNEENVIEVKDNIEDLKTIEIYIRRRDCLNQCKDRAFEDHQSYVDIGDALLNQMQSRRPYEFLHMCYFQMNNFPKAASAAYTYLSGNPNDEEMGGNLQYYVAQPEVDVNEVVDLQGDDYVLLYKLGRKAYKQNNWAETVANMEEVLTDYFSAENLCRMECGRQKDHNGATEFVITITNNMASLLHCQQQCQDKLILLDYNSGVEFLADVLNYLQISYYHLERYSDAAKTVASYLSMLPNDEEMLENKEIYSSLVGDTTFSERSDIVYYFKRDTYEKKLLNIFYQGQRDNPADT